MIRATAMLLLFAAAGCRMAPRDILGTWRSDPEMTLPRLATLDGLPPNVRSNIRKTVGQSQVTFTESTFSVLNLQNHAQTEFPYRVTETTADSITVEFLDDGSAITNTFRFERDGFWVLQSSTHGFWEFFQKTEELPNQTNGR